MQKKILITGITAVMVSGLIGPGSAYIHAAPQEKSPPAFIEAPSYCHEVVKIEREHVYLRQREGKCPVPGPGRIEVTVPASIQSVVVHDGTAVWKKVEVLRADTVGVTSMVEASHEAAEKMQIAQGNTAAHAIAKEAASKAAEKFYAPENQAILQKEQERIKQELFPDVATLNPGQVGDPLAEAYPDAVKKKKNPKKTAGKGLLATDRLYVFFSKSVSPQTIQAYIEMLDKTREPNASMVLRGFVGGAKYIKPTLEYITNLRKVDPACDIIAAKGECKMYEVNVNIDPLLFRRYGITEVPAVVYVRGVTPGQDYTDGSSEGLAGNIKTGDHYVAYGDASLDYLVEQINKEAKSPELAGFLTALRKGWY